MFSNTFNSLNNKVFNDGFIEKSLEMLKRTYTGMKGGTITESFFDANSILGILTELKKNNFLLTQDQTQEDRNEFNDLKNKYQLWKDNFSNALSEEISTRLEYLYKINDKVFIEDEDQCLTCENYAKGVACPLLEALGEGIVCLEDSMIVTNCGFYKEFKRTLRLVENNKSSDTKRNKSKKEDKNK